MAVLRGGETDTRIKEAQVWNKRPPDNWELTSCDLTNWFLPASNKQLSGNHFFHHLEKHLSRISLIQWSSPWDSIFQEVPLSQLNLQRFFCFHSTLVLVPIFLGKHGLIYCGKLRDVFNVGCNISDLWSPGLRCFIVEVKNVHRSLAQISSPVSPEKPPLDVLLLFSHLLTPLSLIQSWSTSVT